jgi:hypothetical protein
MRRSIAFTMAGLITGFAVPAFPDDKEPPLQAHAYIFDRCILSRPATAPSTELAALDVVSSFISSGVSVAYSALESALKSAGDPKEFDQALVALPFYLYTAKSPATPAQTPVSPAPKSSAVDKTGKSKPPVTTPPSANLGCVVLVDGVFDPTVESPSVYRVPGPEKVKSCQTQCKLSGTDCARCLADNNRIPVSDIHLLYEAEVKFADDSSAIVYQSRYLQVADWLQPGRSDRKHSYVITLSLAAPGKTKQDDTVQSTAILDLGAREKGKIYQAGDLPGGTGWLGGGLDLSDLDNSRLADLVNTPGKTIDLRPTTLYASIAETAEGSKFAETLASILDGAKADATKAITSAIDPAQILTAQMTKATTLETAREKEETDYDAFLKAVVAADTVIAASASTPDQIAESCFEVAAAQRLWQKDYNLLLVQNVAPASRTAQPPSGCPK